VLRTVLIDSHTHNAQVGRLEVVQTGRRRRWSEDEKLRIVLESLQAPLFRQYEQRQRGYWFTSWRCPCQIIADYCVGRVRAVVRSRLRAPVAEKGQNFTEAPVSPPLHGNQEPVLTATRDRHRFVSAFRRRVLSHSRNS
jgi:hypothetical protein